MIADMARANRTAGEERIAAELLLKVSVAVSPRTVRRDMHRPVSPRPCSSLQTWSTFVRNYARETPACDSRAENTRPHPESERVLRAIDRKGAAGMSRPFHSAQ